MRPSRAAQPCPSGPVAGAVLLLVGGISTAILTFIQFTPTSCEVDYEFGFTVRRSCNMLLLQLRYIHLWTSTIFIVAGSIGLGAASATVAHRKSGLRTGFIVLSVLIALSVGPTHMIVGGAEALHGEGLGMFSTLGWLHVAAGLAISITAIVASSSFCCCMPIKEYEVEPAPMQITTTYPVVYPTTLTAAALPIADTSHILNNDELERYGSKA